MEKKLNRKKAFAAFKELYHGKVARFWFKYRAVKYKEHRIKDGYVFVHFMVNWWNPLNWLLAILFLISDIIYLFKNIYDIRNVVEALFENGIKVKKEEV